MFNLPVAAITEVKKDETFYVSKMGNGRASLCGNKIVLDVPGDGLHLGMRFTATANNRLIPWGVKSPPRAVPIVSLGSIFKY